MTAEHFFRRFSMKEWLKQKLLEEAKQIAENYDPYSPYSSDNAISSLLSIIETLCED